MKPNQTQDFLFPCEGRGEGGQKNNVMKFCANNNKFIADFNFSL